MCVGRAAFFMSGEKHILFSEKRVLGIVVVYNGMDWLERCLSSLEGSSGVVVDLFIVDNGSDDESRSFVKKNYGHVVYIESDENLGFGKANNLGFQYAIENNYDYVYLLNQDAWVEKNTISSLVKAHLENPGYCLLSPLQLNDNGRLDDNFRHCLNFGIEGDILDDYLLGVKKELYSISAVMAAHWLLSVEALKEIGGFSPTFYHYGEDNNYISRILFRNYKCGVCTDVIGIHDRQNRKYSVKKIAFFKYVEELTKRSDPRVDLNLKDRFKFFVKMLLLAFQIKSFYSIFLLFKLIFQNREIINNKNISICCKQAFL